MLTKNPLKPRPRKTDIMFHSIANHISNTSELLSKFFIFTYNKLDVKVAFLLILLILSAPPIASAFGATAPYWKDQPLIISPGETKTFPIILQNMIGGKNITLKGEITSGSEIAFLTDPNSTYSVPFGKEDIKASLKVEIPGNAKKGNKYIINIFFKQISETEGEMLQISSGVAASFPVIIEKEISESPQQKTESVNSSPISLSYIIIAIIILIISTIIVLFFLMKNQNSGFIKGPLNEHMILNKNKTL